MSVLTFPRPAADAADGVAAGRGAPWVTAADDFEAAALADFGAASTPDGLTEVGGVLDRGAALAEAAPLAAGGFLEFPSGGSDTSSFKVLRAVAAKGASSLSESGAATPPAPAAASASACWRPTDLFGSPGEASLGG